MENPFDAIRSAIQQARDLNRTMDRQADALADLLDGRLRHVSAHYLVKLKKQLREFNAHTEKWKG